MNFNSMGSIVTTRAGAKTSEQKEHNVAPNLQKTQITDDAYTLAANTAYVYQELFADGMKELIN